MFPTKQIVHTRQQHLWSVGEKRWSHTYCSSGGNKTVTWSRNVIIKESYMGHFHAFNLSGVLHSLCKAKWSVGNWSPVGLKYIKGKKKGFHKKKKSWCFAKENKFVKCAYIFLIRNTLSNLRLTESQNRSSISENECFLSVWPKSSLKQLLNMSNHTH